MNTYKNVKKCLSIAAFASFLAPNVMAQVLSDYEGAWLFATSNAHYSATGAGAVTENTGTMRSVCNVTKISSNSYNTDCASGGTLVVTGNQLNSADGVWQITATNTSTLSGSITMNNFVQGDQTISVSMDFTMKKIAPLNTEIGTISLTKSGTTETAAVTGFIESSMLLKYKANGAPENTDATVSFSVKQTDGNFMLFKAAQNPDNVNAVVGSLFVSDLSTSVSTLNSSDFNISSTFSGKDSETGGAFSGSVNVSF